MPKRTSVVDKAQTEAPSMHVAIITLDAHLSSALAEANRRLSPDMPGLRLSLHAAAEWDNDPASLRRCLSDIARADIVVATMLFMEEHVQAVLPALQARRERCDAMVGAMSCGEILRLTRMGRMRMDGSERGAMSLLRRLRGMSRRKKDRSRGADDEASSGSGQMAMLHRIPRLLRFIPGTAQDVRAYFLLMQYWLAGSATNLENMVRMLVARYAAAERGCLRARAKPALPELHHEVGLYHPRLKRRTATRLSELPRPSGGGKRGRVGLILMRSYVLSGDTAHYDAVITALESGGYEVVPVFASSLDSRPAIRAYFMQPAARSGGARDDAGPRVTVDVVVSLTGFSLVGGPAYNDASAAVRMLRSLDVPYLTAHPLEFQSGAQWQASTTGLHPIEATMMVAIPELDGAIAPTVFAGRASAELVSPAGVDGAEQVPDMAEDVRGDASHRLIHPIGERVSALTDRVDALVRLRKTSRSARRVAIVIFNYPPNAGAVGSAAHLAVFESLYNLLQRMARSGYGVEDLPASSDALRERLLRVDSTLPGIECNVCARVPVEQHVRNEVWLKEIEAQWGPAPGRHNSDGRDILIPGVALGNVLVCVQPAFGFEGDPMRLLHDRGFAPTHAFAAFYRYLREGFAAHAVLHFGTHGALEFMPGKQVGLSGDCWPERLLGALPNFYLYAANNPSEGAIARRRSAATLISYLTPPVMHAGLSRSVAELRDSITRWRSSDVGSDAGAHQRLCELIQAQAASLDLVPAAPAWSDPPAAIESLMATLHELESTLVPDGLHVVGAPMSQEQRLQTLLAASEALLPGEAYPRLDPSTRKDLLGAIMDGDSAQTVLTRYELDAMAIEPLSVLVSTATLLAEEHEVDAILHALDGRYVAPAPGGDLLRNPAVLPTGRNIHGFDPQRLPSTFAVGEGVLQAQQLLERHKSGCGALPELVALVLWGSDNLKNEGTPIAQALSLLGARPRLDSYGRLCGASLIPLEELGRPRIDVLLTLSGIFRDLLPLQTRMLAEAAWLAASADEPVALNFVRKHALAYMQAHDCALEVAALRVFSNAEGAYGANVNQLVEQGCWNDEDELAEMYSTRKCYAYGRDGKANRHPQLLAANLREVACAYQNLESLELGVTSLEYYYDTLGGISSAARRARGETVPVYVVDSTHGGGARVRTLSEQVSLESRTRALNPRWQEALLAHGHEGVRHIESHVTNTMAWSATTGQVEPWVYRQLTESYVLDAQMRERMAELNPIASLRVAQRLLEASERNYWQPDPQMLSALREAGEDLEDRIEGVGVAA
ncbi:MAG: magnesium chelatase subunit H [Gammaproteobacteria bacterium]|nr:magnesium chelatase subunit H [Gammaproteobacteria bacterium]